MGITLRKQMAAHVTPVHSAGKLSDGALPKAWLLRRAAVLSRGNPWWARQRWRSSRVAGCMAEP